MMDLEEFATAFTKLRVNKNSPHKPCMLLAVLDLAEAGALANNEIRYLALSVHARCQRPR
jgi:hypothetical protein